MLPFVIDRKKAYDLLVSNGVEVADTRPPPQQRDPKNRLCPIHHTIPNDPNRISTYYDGKDRIEDLQRSLTGQMEDAQFRRFQSSMECGPTDVARLAASRHKYSSSFLTHDTPLENKGKVVSMALRLKLGLPPIPSLFLLYACPLCNTVI